LNSDQTNPTPADIERFTKQDDLDRAWQYLRDQITAQELDRVFTEIEAPLLPVVAAMNHAGISLDVEFLAGLEANYSKMLNEIEQKIYKLVGHEFNAASPKQLGEILFDELNLPKKGIKKTSTGGFSTAESELEKLRGSHPIIPLILSYRELAKLVNTYISALPKLVDPDGRLRATLVQWGTTTGRMSSRAPNLQNIPIRSELGAPIRRAFRASNNQVLVAIDYSQIELRIAAWLSGDEALKQIFQSGGDIHASVAADMFEVSIEEVTTDMRAAAKTINYGILYGMGANALKANLNQTNSEDITKSQALAYLDKYFEAFPKLAEYQKTIKQEVKKHGFTQTYFGRRRYFATIKSKLPYLRAAAERMAVNAPIQGTQADIIKLAMVAVSKWLDQAGLQDEVTLLLQVHDELVFEVNQEKVDEIVPKLVDIMQGVLSPAETGGVIMKADAKVGPNWGEMKPYEKSK
jgi:DNA polymerase I